MGYTFTRIRKRYSIRKDADSSMVLRKLKSYLNASEPELVYFLVNTWNDQGKAITYKELREAILAGDLSTAYLEQWQQDYSAFITEHLQPAWIDAMDAATADMEKKYPSWNFDPYADGVRQWTTNRSAAFVTEISNTQMEGLRAVIQRAAILEDMNVDQLSRAIRPMVGLNHPQSIANLNYFKSLIDSGMAEERAQELSIRYAARQHRYRGYLIARTELAFAYNQGSYEGTKQAQEAGYMGETVKVWSTADDERVCEICGGLDGKQVAMDEDFEFTTKLAPSNPTIKRVPPAHPNCRCAVKYVEISPPVYSPEEEPDTLPDAASIDDDGPAASIPEDYQLPKLTEKGSLHLGGTGQMYEYVDEDGQRWIFKPAQSKGGVPAAYRAYVQEAGYKVQYIVDPETATPVAVFTSDSGQFGAMQKFITGSNIQDELFRLYEGEDIPAAMKTQLMRENVTDWLLANYDAHNRNFIANGAGNLVGLDKEQAFRYLREKSAQAMSYSYNPNAVYGEREPIYNPLYRMFANGEIDLDLNDVLPAIKRVESISNKEYREIFRGYAEGLYGKGKEAEKLLDDIVARKDGLRETYRSFFEELLQERTGIKTAFKFADEGAAAAKQVLSASTMTKEAALAMSSADLKKIAKSQGIPNFGNMTKEQLATCLSDPTQIEAMNEEVKEKLKAQAAKRAAKEAAEQETAVLNAPKAQYTVTNGVYKAAEIFDDFSAVPEKNALGITAASDSGGVEGLNVNIRRITTTSGKNYIEIQGKLTRTQLSELEAYYDSSYTGTIAFSEGQVIDGKLVIDYQKQLANATGIRIRQNDGSFIEIVTDDSQRALTGTFRIRVLDTGDSISDAATARLAMRNNNLGFVLETPTAADEEVMKKARLLWQRDPKAAWELGKQADKMGAVDAMAKNAGITGKDLSHMKMVEVYPGYWTYVNEGAYKAYQKAGMEYVWSGVGSEQSVVRMLKSGGHAGTMTRINAMGIKGGSSADSDIRSGGADSVFTRVASKLAAKEGRTYSESFAAGQYQIILHPSITDRTDWYAQHGDTFGRTSGSYMTGRDSALEFFKGENKSFAPDNEMMFRKGIDVKYWMGIDCETQWAKDNLIAALKAEGIDQINGINVERFIRVNSTVGLPWNQ